MSVMALYRYIVTQPDKELVLENEAASGAFAYREGIRFAAELLAEQSTALPAPFGFDLIVQNADGREIWRVTVTAPAKPDTHS